MYWLDNDSGVTTPPDIPAVVSAVRQYFTEGGAGEQPSIPGGDWFNMITDEVLAVLAEAGIAPDKASHTQLRDAIKMVVANAAATQAEVNESNPENQVDKYVTVKTLWGWVKQASETVLGMMKVATQAQTNAGTADDVAVTPKKLRAGFAVSLAANGYIAFPAWLGGLIIQWGQSGGTLANGGVGVAFPITFPNTAYQITACSIGNTTAVSAATASSDLNAAGCTLWVTPAQAGVGIRYIVIGR